MKRIVLVAFLSWCMSGLTQAQGIEFFHGNWSEAKEMAQKEQKLIFVDAFASWCGPCKRMAREVFTDAEVGVFFNANFICMKIDMELPENSEFAGKYPVSAYPTLMFIDKDGKISLKQVGGQSVAGLLELGQKAIGSMDNLPAMDEQYESGNREPAFLYDYVRALNRSGKPSLKITNAYLATQSDLNTDFNRHFIFDGVTEADSRVFDLLVKDKAAISALVSPEAYKAKVETACKQTLKKAIEFRSEDLLKEAKDKMKSAFPDRSVSFNYEADLQYFAATKDVKRYLATATSYQKKVVKNNAAKLNDMVRNMLRAFPDDPQVLAKAAVWEQKAVESGGLPEYYLTLAEIYKRQGKNKEAVAVARKGVESMGDVQNATRVNLDYLIRSLE